MTAEIRIVHHPEYILSHHYAHIESRVYRGRDAAFLPVRAGVIEADKRIIFGNTYALFSKKLEYHIQYHIVAADKGGSLRETPDILPEFSGKGSAVMALFGGTPSHIFVFENGIIFNQGTHETVVFFLSLIVVVDEYTGDMAVSRPGQTADQLIGAEGIVDDDLMIRSPYVIVIEPYDKESLCNSY